MSLIIIHPNPDGTAATTHLAPDGTQFSRQPNPDQGPRPTIEQPKPGSNAQGRPGRPFIVPEIRTPQAEAKAILGENAQFHVIDEALLPDPYFRDAWMFHVEQFVVIDPLRAKAVHAGNLRRQRKPLLEALDVEVMRAIEQGHDTSALVAKKQVLRDITKNLPSDPVALKAVQLPS